MALNRRDFLKIFSKAVACAVVAPSVIIDSIKTFDVRPAQIKHKILTRVNYREQAKKELSEWWAKEFDRQMF